MAILPLCSFSPSATTSLSAAAAAAAAVGGAWRQPQQPLRDRSAWQRCQSRPPIGRRGAGARAAARPRYKCGLGKSRQISLGRSNLSFIARINADGRRARWMGRHLCRFNSNSASISSSSSSTLTTQNDFIFTIIISTSALRRRQAIRRPRRRQSRQVSLVTNSISRRRPIFAAHTFIDEDLRSQSPTTRLRYSIISNFISSAARRLTAVDWWHQPRSPWRRRMATAVRGQLAEALSSQEQVETHSATIAIGYTAP